jgi:tRNA pseudouridine32 synthase/23S rRNA pseudouridine746 synthase
VQADTSLDQIKIVFENRHFAVVDKPAGWLSVPSRQGEDDSRPVLGRHLEKQLNCKIWPVHRLDLEVSGLILFAKSAEAHRAANKWFEQHEVVKTYEAWTRDSLDLPTTSDWMLWESKIQRGKKRSFEAPHGKPARTNAKLVERLEIKGVPIAIWYLQPLTGRSHQLRFELYKRKHPIIGDALYGSNDAANNNQIALRCFELDFSRCRNHAEFGLGTLLTIDRIIAIHDLCWNLIAMKKR